MRPPGATGATVISAGCCATCCAWRFISCACHRGIWRGSTDEPAMTRRHLVLFVRAPRLGAGKRRLARDIGDVAALRFERAMLDLLVRRLGRDRRWRLRLA